MSYIKYCLSLLPLLFSMSSLAGTNRPVTDTIDYHNEWLWVFERNQTIDNEEINFRYYVHQVNGATTTVDSLRLTGRFQGKRYIYTVGDIVQVQDENYRATLYRPDSTLRVEKTDMGAAFKALYQLNVIDPAMYNKFVDTLLIRDSGQHRIISLLFKRQAPFIQYEVVYRKADYHLEKIQYLIRGELAPANDPAYVPTRYRRITLVREANSPVTYARPITTQDYITRQDGKLIPSPAYANYRIIAATNNPLIP